MARNNHKGRAIYSRDPWKAFDALPPTARAALANASFNWAASPLLRAWKRGVKGYKTGADLAARVAEWDRAQHEKDARRGVVPRQKLTD